MNDLIDVLKQSVPFDLYLNNQEKPINVKYFHGACQGPAGEWLLMVCHPVHHKPVLLIPYNNIKYIRSCFITS